MKPKGNEQKAKQRAGMTTVLIHDETRNELMNIKYDLGLASVDAVIKSLLARKGGKT